MPPKKPLKATKKATKVRLQVKKAPSSCNSTDVSSRASNTVTVHIKRVSEKTKEAEGSRRGDSKSRKPEKGVLPVWVTWEVNKVQVGDLPEEDVNAALMLAERALLVVQKMAESGDSEDQLQEAHWKLAKRIAKLGDKKNSVNASKFAKVLCKEPTKVNSWSKQTLTKFGGTRFNEFVAEVNDMVKFGNLRIETQFRNLREALLREVDRDLLADIEEGDPGAMEESIRRLQQKYDYLAVREVRQKAARVSLPLKPGLKEWFDFLFKVRALKTICKFVGEDVQKEVWLTLYFKVPEDLHRDLFRGRKESFDSLISFIEEQVEFQRRVANANPNRGWDIRGHQTGRGMRGAFRGQHRGAQWGPQNRGQLAITNGE